MTCIVSYSILLFVKICFSLSKSEESGSESVSFKVLLRFSCDLLSS